MVYLAEFCSVSHDEFVSRDQDIELERLDFCCVFLRPLVLCPHIVNAAHIWEPLSELGLPVDNHGIGNNDQVRSIDALVLHQVCQQSHDLWDTQIDDDMTIKVNAIKVDTGLQGNRLINQQPKHCQTSYVQGITSLWLINDLIKIAYMAAACLMLPRPCVKFSIA